MEIKNQRKIVNYGELYEQDSDIYLTTREKFEEPSKLYEEEATPLSNRSINPKRFTFSNFLIEERNLTMATKQLHDKHRFTIPVNNVPKQIFDSVINMLLIYSVISSLYYLGYSHPAQRQLSFDIFVWVCFILDLFLNFFTERLDKKNRPVKNLKIIASKYARTWMTFDILSLLPFQFVGFPEAEFLLRLFRIFKMGRVYKMIRIEKINKSLGSLFFGDNFLNLKKFKIIVAYSLDLLYQILVMLFFLCAILCLVLFGKCH